MGLNLDEGLGLIHLSANDAPNCMLVSATPHGAWVIEGEVLARIVSMHDKYPVLGGLMTIGSRVFVHQTVFKFAIDRQIFWSVAKLGRKGNESPVRWRKEVFVLPDHLGRYQKTCGLQALYEERESPPTYPPREYSTSTSQASPHAKPQTQFINQYCTGRLSGNLNICCRLQWPQIQRSFFRIPAGAQLG